MKRSRALHEAWLPKSHSALLPELIYYFNNAFGNWTRIDYGSGHELSFLGYLTVLRYTGLLNEQDEQDMVFSLFERYLNVCRKLQKVYRLEPAGSKGVWGLEDHQFLNYLWGSSQLIGQRPSNHLWGSRTDSLDAGQSEITPKHILEVSRMDSSTVSAYIFLSSISHIATLKRGPFNEHSPILHNIASTVPNWKKVNSGLMKMYQAEVLEKHPVVQHFWFGGILSWTKAGTSEKLPSSGDRRHKEEDEDDATVDKQTNWQVPTQAPWAHSSFAQRQGSTSLPEATTAALWARTTQVPAQGAGTTVPWGSAQSVVPPRQSEGTTRFGMTSRVAQPTSRTLASTGSAAAMSSPLGAISQPLTGAPRPQAGRKM